MTALLTPTPAKARRLLFAGLVTITALSWLYLVVLGVRMSDMGSPLAMPMTSAWTLADALLMWTMWAVMMAGMMLPSAAPMIGAYSQTINSDRGGLSGSTSSFVAGYLVIWSTFALVATIVQWVLHDAALVTAMGESRSNWLGGPLLVVAGAYQFTGLKDACLGTCRTPLGFLLNEWRGGRRGAFVMGVRHGGFCVGCCWALMALLFVLGVMNLWWIAVVAAVILLEKVLPTDALTKVLGVGLVVWGGALVVGVG